MNRIQPRKRKVLHYVIEGKDVFGEWLDDLRDVAGRDAILKRIDRAEDGNFGDHCFVGDGVREMRIDFGPGYRLYYGEDGPILVLLLCAGDKSTQTKDIRKARALWAEYRRLK